MVQLPSDSLGCHGRKDNFLRGYDLVNENWALVVRGIYVLGEDIQVAVMENYVLPYDGHILSWTLLKEFL